MKQICLAITLVFALILGSVDSAFSNLVGRFIPPASLPWERVPDLDEDLVGPAIGVEVRGGEKIYISFGDDPISCDPGEVKLTADAAIQSFLENYPGAPEIMLPLDKRPWRAILKYFPDKDLSVYTGCTYIGRELFLIMVVQDGKGPLPDDFKGFFSKITTSTRFKPSKATSLVGEGNALAGQKQFDQARAKYARALSIDPGFWPAYYYRGITHRRMKAWDKGVRDLEKALEYEKHGPAYLELARCYEGLGRADAAEKAFGRALEINPEDDQALVFRGDFYVRQGKEDAALKDYDKSLGINPCRRGAAYNAAQVLLHRKKDPKGASRYLEQVLAIYPDYQPALVMQKETKVARASQPSKGEKHASTGSPGKDLDQAPAGSKVPAGNGKTPVLQELPAWISRLPAVPVVQPVRIAEKADYSKLNRTRYAGIVSSAKAAVRELLGPMDASAQKRFDKAWEPMFDYPAPECIQYLEKLVPLVEKSLGLRAALGENLKVYERLWREAGHAAYYSADAAENLMQAVSRQAGSISSLKGAITGVADQLGELGDPPNPVVLKAQAAGRYRRTMGTLSGLLGKSAPIAGRYERIGLVTAGHRHNEPDKTYLSRIPVGDNMEHQVIKPLGRKEGNLVLFYCFSENDQSGDSSDSLFSFDFEPESWWVMYAEPTDGGWVTYDYDEEDGEIWATFYRPDETSLVVDSFSLNNGRIDNADRTTYDRMPAGQYAKEYVTGESEKTVKAKIAKNKTELEGNRQSFLKGRRAFQNFLQAGGTLPELAKASQLYWVLTDVRMAKRIDQKSQLMKTDLEDEVIKTLNEHTTASSFDVTWEKHTTEYEYRSVSSADDPANDEHYVSAWDQEEPSTMQRVITKDEVEKGEARIQWQPAPAIIPDGGSWDLNPRGGGSWGFSINGNFDPDHPLTAGLILNVGTGGNDKFFLWEEKPSPDVEVSAFKGIPKDGHLMQLVCNKDRVDVRRYLQFRSDGVTDRQDRYVIPLVLSCAAGAMKVEYEYALKILTGEEAEEIAARGGVSLNVADASRKTDTAAEAAAAKNQENIKERMDLHKANISFCKQTIQRLSGQRKALKEKLKSGKANKEDIARYNQLQFMITCQQSEIVTENDRIRELQTGKAHFSRTPFDDMCRAQVVQKAEAEVRALDQAARGMKKAEWLASKLGPGQRAKARKLIGDCIKSGGSVDPAAWTRLNSAMQNLYQGEQALKLARIEEEIAWKQAQLSAVENIKTGADVGMTLLPMAGGPMAVVVAYQTGCGFAEGGILEGVKRGLTTYSDAADVAVSAYDGWKRGGWLGAVESASWSILMNKGPEAALGRLNMKTSRGFDGGYGPVGQPVKSVSRGAEAIQAAKFQQELEYGKAVGEDFFREYRTLRTAELKGTATRAELDQMRMAVRQKAAAVNHSMTAKNYLKYGAEPIKGKAYSETMDDILGDAVSAYNWEMRNRGFNEQTLYHCRNASSTGAGMDADLALKEQKRIIPVRGKDGKITYKRNHWIRKNGKPVGLAKYQKEGAEVMAAAYKKVTGGYNAKQSFVELTTSKSLESYPDTSWLQLPKAGAHSDMGAVNKRLDDFFGKIDPNKLPATLEITSTKAEIMFKEHPELRKLGSLMETCRGTAKDLDTKFIPLVESRIRGLETKGNLGASDKKRLLELQTTRDQLKTYRSCFVEIGQGKIPPYEWNHRFRMVTGGQDAVSVVKRLAKMTEMAAK